MSGKSEEEALSVIEKAKTEALLTLERAKESNNLTLEKAKVVERLEKVEDCLTSLDKKIDIYISKQESLCVYHRDSTEIIKENVEQLNHIIKGNGSIGLYGRVEESEKIIKYIIDTNRSLTDLLNGKDGNVGIVGKVKVAETTLEELVDGKKQQKNNIITIWVTLGSIIVTAVVSVVVSHLK